MESLPKMDVGDWQESPLPIAPKTKVRRRFLPSALIGTLGTLTLHAMLIQSVSFGSRNPKPRAPETQESASALSTSNADAVGLVLISLPTTVNANQAATPSLVASLPDLSKMKVKPQIDADLPALFRLESLALSEDQASGSTFIETDGAEQTRLFGIYTGQIQARIDRVWRRPRTPVTEVGGAGNPGESFQCQAQIVQDGRGNVEEILLPRCNGSHAWQRSLLLAIQQSSPLPAPPSARVFAQTISLQFVGLPYVSNSSPEEYEFEPNVVPRSD